MEVYAALAQPKRGEILRLLAGRELSAGVIAVAVCRHAARHVSASEGAQGRGAAQRAPRRHQAPAQRAGGGLEDLQSFLAEVLPDRLERLKRAAEEEERSARDGRRAKRK